jgi:hypothetical protein
MEDDVREADELSAGQNCLSPFYLAGGLRVVRPPCARLPAGGRHFIPYPQDGYRFLPEHSSAPCTANRL